MSACTPLRDLSSYSGDRAPNAGAGSDTLGPVVPAAPTPLPEAGGAPAGGDAAAPGGSTLFDASGDAGPSRDAGPSSPLLDCDGLGDIATQGGCYSFAVEAASWVDASAACAAWGGALTRIDTSDEESFVRQGARGDAWLGLNDRQSEGAMVWDDGAELGAYRNWAVEQPDDFDGTEDCVELLADGRGWNDRPCSDQRVYVCER